MKLTVLVLASGLTVGALAVLGDCRGASPDTQRLAATPAQPDTNTLVPSRAAANGGTLTPLPRARLDPVDAESRSRTYDEASAPSGRGKPPEPAAPAREMLGPQPDATVVFDDGIVWWEEVSPGYVLAFDRHLPGVLMEEGGVRGGKRHGAWKTYQNGIVIREGEFLNGVAHGRFLGSLDDGSPAFDANVVAGQFHGECWFYAGNMVDVYGHESGIYEMGELVEPFPPKAE